MGDAYLPGEGSTAESGIELDLCVFGAAAPGEPHCHRHWSRSQKQLAVCWCGGSSGEYGAGCGVAGVSCDDMAVAFLGVVSAHGVDADDLRLGPPRRRLVAAVVAQMPCFVVRAVTPALM